MNRRKLYLAVLGSLAVSTGAAANTFVNGAFESGNANGWTVGQASRSGASNSSLNPTAYLNGQTGRSAVITNGTVDPNVGAALGSTVYSGTYSYRVEDTNNGGLLSVLSQTVTNYTDANIFFAWKAVLEGAHGPEDSASVIIKLEDLTTNTTLINRNYNAGTGSGGVDLTKFVFNNNIYYTPQWQIEQLAIGAGLAGHDFRLSVLATDCAPTGHYGYVYLDGFGAVTPPPIDPGTPVPVPATLALMGIGLLGMGVRRKQK